MTLGQAFGVELDADFPVPGLLDLRSPPAGRASLRRVEEADLLAAWPEGGTRLAGDRTVGDRTLGWWERHPDAGYLLGGPGYGTFVVATDGGSVACAPTPVEPWKWQRFLIGQVLPLLSVLHGHEVFHAAVLERDGRAVAITGPSGAGKSTLAAGLVRDHGHRYVADDVLAVRPPGVDAQPGVALTSLRLDAAGDGAALGTEIGRDDVEGVRLLVELCPTPVPLAAVFVLQRDGAASGTTVERQRPVDPRVLLAAGYNFVVPDRERWLRQLEVCSAIATRVPVHTVTIGADATPASSVAALVQASA